MAETSQVPPIAPDRIRPASNAVRPDPPGPDPRQACWSRALDASRKLHEALEALDDLGGLEGLASTWTPKARTRAVEALASAHAALGSQLSRLRGRPARQQPKERSR